MGTRPAPPTFPSIFRRLHAAHPRCLADPWLREPCRLADGTPEERSTVWSRRNGPWRQHDVIFIGAAPGNAGGRGTGDMGAHATRIPFGGDIAGANLDVLLASAGLDRNHTFIAAAFNRLPAAGGGEPTVRELLEPAGDYPTSLHVIRDTLLAAGPRLVVALGNVALRVVLGAARVAEVMRLPSQNLIEKAGVKRGRWSPWPSNLQPDHEFQAIWDHAWQRPLPALLWLTHPSAQNMSPYARPETLFHTRMLDARAALRQAVAAVLGRTLPAGRTEPPRTGIYALPEWRERIGPRHQELTRRWSDHGV